jgi:hypothetical protein
VPTPTKGKVAMQLMDKWKLDNGSEISPEIRITCEAAADAMLLHVKVRHMTFKQKIAFWDDVATFELV